MDMAETNRILRDFEPETELKKSYPDVDEAVYWLLQELTPEQYNIVMTLVCRICPECYSRLRPCHCWRGD